MPDERALRSPFAGLASDDEVAANFLRWLELQVGSRPVVAKNGWASPKEEPTLPNMAEGGQLISQDSTEPPRSRTLLSLGVFGNIVGRPAVPAVVT